MDGFGGSLALLHVGSGALGELSVSHGPQFPPLQMR